MAIVEDVLGIVRRLPPGKQQQVLDYAESLQQGTPAPERRPRRSLRGLWAGLDGNVTDEDIAEARREMCPGEVARP